MVKTTQYLRKKTKGTLFYQKCCERGIYNPLSSLELQNNLVILKPKIWGTDFGIHAAMKLKNELSFPTVVVGDIPIPCDRGEMFGEQIPAVTETCGTVPYAQ